MSEISDTARVSVLLADFANVDGSGKLNLIGGGVAITVIDPQTGQTAPLSLVVLAAVDPKFVGQQYALEIGLYADDDGQLVTLPGPVASSPMRIAQPVSVQSPTGQPGAYLPPGSVWPATQMIVNFSGGLALSAGRAYEWRATIDTNIKARTGLLVAGPPPLTFG